MSYSPTAGEVFKCDLCDGDPKCVKFCSSGAIQFVDPAESPERKKVIAERFKEVFGEEVSE
jgi:Fe-S-cluster-containing hydrogenase component 2